ncbi:MAG TPA: tetratricopeptide repeat protein [Candidatus Methylomirabilis sp.]|nr:tetratricopeptide repeat protein [Candidatus Methylomirabilis sp.]
MRDRTLRASAARSSVGEFVERQGPLFLPALLALLTLVAFLGTLGNGFVAWDDDRNLLYNAGYRGLGWPQLRWMFTTFFAGHYIPLTWLTFGLDYSLWGINPAGYHLTNLLLHIANTVLFYAIAVRLLADALPRLGEGAPRRLGAGLAALLFALHPLRVESVAWATERRDVLCGLFYLASVLAYLRAGDGGREGPRWGSPWYAASVGLAAAALLSKSMAVSLPVVLLILDVYPLRRLGGVGGWRGGGARRVLLEKVPFVLLTGVASAVALVALWHVQGFAPIAKLGAGERLAISAYALAFYLWKAIAPFNLSPLYELPERIDLWGWPYAPAMLVVAALSLAALWGRRRWPGFAAAWVGYIAILFPVLGIVQNGWQIAADRYTYLAGMGWALLAGAVAARWCGARPEAQGRREAALALAAALIAAILGALTWEQAKAWHDTRALWTRAIDSAPSATAHYNLGVLLVGRGEFAEAAAHYRSALAIEPGFAEAHNNLGVALTELGQRDDAIRHYREALRIKPAYADARRNLEQALIQNRQ